MLRKVPIYLFTYHKCGTSLIASVFRDICSRYEIPLYLVPGYCHRLLKPRAVYLLTHSLTNPIKINWPFRGIHLTRDSRSVVYSGYFYHLGTGEAWCTNSNFDVNSVIRYPQVLIFYNIDHRK